MSPDWLSFTGEALIGVLAVPSELRFTGCTAQSLLTSESLCRFYTLSSHATWAGTTSLPATDRCEDDNSEKHNATE